MRCTPITLNARRRGQDFVATFQKQLQAAQRDYLETSESRIQLGSEIDSSDTDMRRLSNAIARRYRIRDGDYVQVTVKMLPDLVERRLFARAIMLDSTIPIEEVQCELLLRDPQGGDDLGPIARIRKRHHMPIERLGTFDELHAKWLR